MCLAIPGKVLHEFESGGMRMAKVQFGGIVREASLDYVPEVRVGDYVLVHVGFALAAWTKKRPPAPTRPLRIWTSFPS
jgi:hydrogenase expression/formation protein HypC